MKNFILSLVTVLFGSFYFIGFAQPCTPTPTGDQVSYGSNNVWIGYVYNNINLTEYYGFVNQGSAANPNFDQNFGGSNVNYPTSNCSVSTTTFSVRYKLRKTFAPGGYQFTVGGDDGYRLSINGGATWLIDRWVDQGYTIATAAIYLDGEYDLVLEYYENSGDNRISFSLETACVGPENQAVYGTGNIWNGYIYDGTNFQVYKGRVQEGNAGNPNFDQSYGGDNVSYATSSCPVQTETYSARYLLTKNFFGAEYTFVVGGDDGYRLSLDGGTTWVIDNWNDHSYTTSTYTTNLSGIRNMVLEYYENGGHNRLSFELRSNIILPVYLVNFDVTRQGIAAILNWQVTANSDPSSFIIERSIDGTNYTAIGSLSPTANSSYLYRDNTPPAGLVYYRLQMKDISGVINYSPVVTLRPLAGSQALLTLFPTMVKDRSFYLRTNKLFHHAILLVTDMTGRTIMKKSINELIPGTTIAITLPATAVVNETYIVSIYSQQEKILTQKITVQ